MDYFKGTLTTPSPWLDSQTHQHIINCINHPAPDVSARGRNLLKSYFLSIRKVHKDDIPPWTFHTLVRLAVAHARLCLASVVEVPDALVAIELVEESLVDQGKQSVLGWRRGSPRNIYLYGKRVSECYEAFYQHLKQFCALSGCSVIEE